MPYAELPCSVCNQPGNEPCVNLRTGKPLKYFHKDGRVIRIQVQTARQIMDQRGI